MTDLHRKSKLITHYLLNTFVKMVSPVPDFLSLLDDLKDSEESVGRKIDRAYSALQDTSHLVKRLEVELTEKLSVSGLLKSEYDKYSVLAAVEERKARALLMQLDETLNKGKVHERWVAFGINIAAGLIMFLLGAALGPWLGGFLGIVT